MWGRKAHAFDPTRSMGTRSCPFDDNDHRDRRGRWRKSALSSVSHLPLTEALDELFAQSQMRVIRSIQTSVIRIQDRMRDEGIRIDRKDLQFEEYRR